MVIIDDDADLAEALKELLADAYSVAAFNSGDEGVKQLSARTQAVILDIKMQDKNGFDVCVDIKQRFMHLPVIFHTAYQDLKDPFEIINEYRPFGYVIKGGNPQTLLDTVASAVMYSRELQRNWELVAQLREMNATLEDRVRERTQALEQAIAQISALAMTDSLTSIPNRRAFFSQFDKEMQRAIRFQRPLAFMIIDVDAFKTINDNHGHAFGDTVLKTLSELLRQNLRSIDTLGRLGGDEFGVLLPETDLEAASACAERLRRVVAESARLQPNGGASAATVAVTLSIGCCVCKGSAVGLDEVFTKADEALYTSKRQGRNRVTSAIYDTRAAPPA